MNDDTLHAHIARLEARLMHQEAAIDELTRTLVNQEQRLRRQSETILRLETLIRGLSDMNMARPEDEPVPPHY
jgi:SlyX protein